MQFGGVVLCNNTLQDLFRVLEIEGLGFLKNEDESGFIFRAFSHRTIEWALGEYRDEVVSVLSRFASFSRTAIGILSFLVREECIRVCFVLTGRTGFYALPMAELTPNSSSVFLPMNLIDVIRGQVFPKGARVMAEFQATPYSGGDASTCLIWCDSRLMDNIDS